LVETFIERCRPRGPLEMRRAGLCRCRHRAAGSGTASTTSPWRTEELVLREIAEALGASLGLGRDRLVSTRLASGAVHGGGLFLHDERAVCTVPAGDRHTRISSAP
jgi:hypothetical protein